MKISRIDVASTAGAIRSHVFDPELVTISETSPETDDILVAFEDLYLGEKRNSRVFAAIEGIEIELTDDMIPLIGQRFGGQFNVIDLSVPLTPGSTAANSNGAGTNEQ